MNNDNVLRKEFSKKDVERARNLIKGDTNARTSQGVGYTKKSEYLLEHGMIDMVVHRKDLKEMISNIINILFNKEENSSSNGS